MLIANISESAQRIEDHYQTISIFNKVNVLFIKSELNLYQWIYIINQMNELFNKYKQAISEKKLKFHSTKLKNCKVIDDVLFKKRLTVNFWEYAYEIATENSWSAINFSLRQ